MHRTLNFPSKARKSLAFAALMTFGLLAEKAEAAVLITTSGSGSTEDFQLVISEVEFEATVNYAGGILLFVIKDAHPSAVPRTNLTVNSSATLGGGTLADLVDGGVTGGSVTSLDAYFFTFTASAFSIGDTVTFSGGTITQTGGPNADFDDFSTGTYEVFLADGSGNSLSTNGVAVPEPSSALLLGLGSLGLLARRRRSA